MQMTNARILIAGLGVILAGLAGLKMGHLGGLRKGKERDITIVRLVECERMCRKYHRLFGMWPASVTDLVTKLPSPQKASVLDGWGRPMLIFPQTNGAPGTGPRLVSYGADGQPGGEGEDADVELFM